MIRTGKEYRDSLRDGRDVWINGERVRDVTTHPMFKPLVDIRARIYDMAHEPKTAGLMTYEEEGERYAIGLKLPFTRAGLARQAPRRRRRHARHRRHRHPRRRRDHRRDVVAVGRQGHPQRDRSALRPEYRAPHPPRRSSSIPSTSPPTPIPRATARSVPQDQDPDMLVHVVKETDAGIVIRGAKYETAAAYANQAFLKPTIANWGDSKLSEYALGCIVRMNAPGVKHICRTGFAGRAPERDYPLSNRFDEVDTLDHPRQRADPLGRRALLPAHARRRLHPPDAAPLFGLPLRAADALLRRSHDRRGAVEREADRPRQAAGRPGEARRARRVARGHQRPSDRRRRDRREEPERPSHAQPVLAVHRPRPRHDQPAARHAHRPRAVRRPDLRHARRRRLRESARPGRGWRNSTPSTTNGWPTTAAGSWPSPATFSTPTMPAIA